MTKTITLIEGETYSISDLHAKLIKYGMTDDDAQRYADSTTEELLTLELPASATHLSNNQYTWQYADADSDDDEETSGIFLARIPHGRKKAFTLRHLVGSAALNNGVTLEILPKTTKNDNNEASRASFQRMWAYANDLNFRELHNASPMNAEQLPLHEWLIQRLLDDVDRLLSKGIRSHYVEEEDNLQTVRGRISLRHNIRLNSFAPNRFYCRYEEFSPNRPENRLIKSAIIKVMNKTRSPENRKRAAFIREWMHEIPVSSNLRDDFMRWKNDRLMADYQSLRSTCEWILFEQAPNPLSGSKKMFGRFVRMNDVFERYITRWIAERSISTLNVFDQKTGPDASKSLYKEGIYSYFMYPDIRLYKNSNCLAILDAKWKTLSDKQNTPSGGDLYQIFAYAYHWLSYSNSDIQKIIGLIYPTTSTDDISTMFTFPMLAEKGICGVRLQFLLPQRNKEGEWTEGFLVKDDCFPFFSTDDAKHLLAKNADKTDG